MDLYARERWFYQATLCSKRMFARNAGPGSIYMMSVKDNKGAFLNGSVNYKLNIPGPVPAGQFWSMTVYDVRNRSEVVTDQNKASLSSLNEKFQTNSDGSIDLYVGPDAPKGFEKQWIKTRPNEGWFTYFRIYGIKEDAVNGKWKLNDFEKL
ncbi:hypothetical protein MsAg5_09940 [Methanosarcinaceae archaeon Ag5]|uniref:DUF1214 domain-containing protein n=1 Tax=Methanolapillus africanus TaxID=3028297 RepID=A0AAE4MIC6_9EURY|nr:hypothetical protein [Methanosarcinaceae archaeon Ag5]